VVVGRRLSRRYRRKHLCRRGLQSGARGTTDTIDICERRVCMSLKTALTRCLSLSLSLCLSKSYLHFYVSIDYIDCFMLCFAHASVLFIFTQTSTWCLSWYFAVICHIFLTTTPSHSHIAHSAAWPYQQIATSSLPPSLPSLPPSLKSHHHPLLLPYCSFSCLAISAK